ncbi:MAG: flippase [Bacteroidales bacterium]|jgi:O-antigen/teichoic acid export membrane protein|nr:flippase [Bacteroidales bacterium]
MSEVQTSSKREIKDVFYLIAMQGVSYIAPLLVLPYLMKVLGAEKFGYIGFSLAVMQYLMLIVDFGFNFTATKRIALAKGNREELNNIFTSTLYAKLGLLAVSFLVLIVITLIPRFAIYRETMFMMFLMVVGHALTFVWLFQGLGQIRFIAIFNAIAKLSILPLTFVFVKSADDYLIAAFLQSFVVIFAMLISFVYIIKKRWVKITAFVRNNVIEELKEAYPIFLSGAATSVYTVSFVVMLGYFATPEEVGQYSAVDRIMRALCWLIFIPTSQAFYPKIVSLGAENKSMALTLIKKIFIFVVVAMSVIFFAMFFLSPYAVEFLGEDYRNTLPLFRIMAFVPFFVGAGGVLAQLGILALGNDRDKINYQRVYFIAGIVALISILASIPSWGAMGAAVSLLLTEMVVCGLMFWFGKIVILKK